MSWSCPAGVWVARGRRCPRGSLEVDGETEIAAGGLSSLQVCSGEERSSQRSASLCEYSQRHGFGQSMGLWLRGLVWGWEAFDSPPAQWRSLLPLWAQRRLWEGHTYAVGPNRPWTEAAGTPPPPTKRQMRIALIGLHRETLHHRSALFFRRQLIWTPAT